MTDDLAFHSPAVLLINPQLGQNIGASARAMLNFGLSHMRVVNPRDGWPSQSAIAMASGAARVLDDAQIFRTTHEALEGLTYVYATTARIRDFTKPVLTPEAAMKDAFERSACGERIGLMFGPERSGLENNDIIRANAIITIPVNPDYASLNLAQSVLLCAYEWRRLISGDETNFQMKSEERATGHDVDILYQKLETALDARNFFWPEEKSESMRMNLRNLLSRIEMSKADLKMLHGVTKFLSRPPK